MEEDFVLNLQEYILILQFRNFFINYHIITLK